MELDFNVIVNIIETRRKNVYVKINEELICMYWEIGKYISELSLNSKWGDKCIEQISGFMKENYPILKGFSRPGLYRMKQLYETYKDEIIVSPLVRQLSWTNNVLILSTTKTMEEKEFYIRMCIKNNYSKRELERQINSSYFERYMLSNGKVNENLNALEGEEDFPNTRILDTYSLEFLDLPNNYTEKDLKNAIMSNLKDFILEIGNDFTFVAQEYRITVGDEDFYIDLLFFHRTFKCLVAVELKIGAFRPEYISKMDFYLEALDRHERKSQENPSIGIILCSDKSETLVKYSMSRTVSPTLVSKYKLELIDKKLLKNKIDEIKYFFEKEKVRQMKEV